MAMSISGELLSPPSSASLSKVPTAFIRAPSRLGETDVCAVLIRTAGRQDHIRWGMTMVHMTSDASLVQIAKQAHGDVERLTI